MSSVNARKVLAPFSKKLANISIFLPAWIQPFADLVPHCTLLLIMPSIRESPSWEHLVVLL